MLALPTSSMPPRREVFLPSIRFSVTWVVWARQRGGRGLIRAMLNSCAKFGACIPPVPPLQSPPDWTLTPVWWEMLPLPSCPLRDADATPHRCKIRYGPVVVYGLERHWHLLHVCRQDEVFFPPLQIKRSRGGKEIIIMCIWVDRNVVQICAAQFPNIFQ